jgi:hypothetical protein
VGGYTLTVAKGTLASSNYSFNLVNGTLTVGKATLTVKADNKSRQYSDPNPSFTATITGFVNGETLVTSGVTGSPDLNTVADQNSVVVVGGYPITVSTGTLASANYAFTFVPGTLTINPENARVDYTGEQIKATATATTTTATVTLRANIMDITVPQNPADPNYDMYPGDIRNAKVMFVNRDASNAPISGWIPVSTLVNTGDTKIGTVSHSWTVNLGTLTDVQTTVGIIVNNGSYIRDEVIDNVVVTVYKPNGDFITGGGTIIPTLSVGSMKSDPGLKTNFGFNVKFNKSGTNLQGNMNIIFRRKESDGKVHSYQIKANAMVSLGVNVTNVKRKTAQYVSKTSLADVTNPLAPVPMGGNKYLYVNMIDNGEPGTKDSISFVLVEGTSDPSVLSNIIYSSNWISNKTQQMNLSGGNIVVHSGFNVGSSSQTISTQQPVAMSEVVQEAADAKFGLKAFPNPSRTQFSVHVESSDRNGKINLRVYDLSGRIVRVIPNLTAGQTIQLGSEYRPGIYFVEMIQGKNRTQVKLVKTSD